MGFLEEMPLTPPSSESIVAGETNVAPGYLVVELGRSLMHLADRHYGAVVLQSFSRLRAMLSEEHSLALPAVHFRDNLWLAPQSYVIRFGQVEAARGELQPGRLLATVGSAVRWVDRTDRVAIENEGGRTWEPADALAAHVGAVVCSRSSMFQRPMLETASEPTQPPATASAVVMSTARKVAMLVLSLSGADGLRWLARLPQSAAREVANEMAALQAEADTGARLPWLLHKVAEEFMGLVLQRCRLREHNMAPASVHLETERLSLADPLLCAAFIRRIWLEEKSALLRFQNAVAAAPERMAEMLARYFENGATLTPVLTGAEKAAIFLQCVPPPVADAMTAWFDAQRVTLPATRVETYQRTAVMGEFVRRFYTQFTPRETFLN
jgi:hypothetical protein